MAFQARFCFLFLTVWGRSYWNGIAKLIKSCVVPHEVQGCVKIMRCVLSRRILEKVRGTSCYSGDLSRWDLSFLGPKFNQQHMNKTWMSVRVYKGWFCSSTAGFVNKNAPTFSSSICVPYHPVRLFSFTVLLNISVFSAFFFFFLIGRNSPFSILSVLFLPAYHSTLDLSALYSRSSRTPSLLPAACISMSSASVLIPTVLIIIVSQHSHTLFPCAFTPLHGPLYSHLVHPKYLTYSVSFSCPFKAPCIYSS